MSNEMSPALTDCNFFMIFPGNTVEKIEDKSRFVVSEVVTIGTHPGVVEYLLKDGNGGVVDALDVMLIDEELKRNAWQNAGLCEVCSNHYNGGVTWFDTQLNHPKEGSVYSACHACLLDIDPSILPEIDFVS